jgi:hypothetical protein
MFGSGMAESGRGGGGRGSAAGSSVRGARMGKNLIDVVVPGMFLVYMVDTLLVIHLR